MLPPARHPPPNAFGWAACSWRDCSAAGSGPEDSSPVSFHGGMRDDATMKIALFSSRFVSFLLCHFSRRPRLHSAAFPQRPPLSPRIVVHCLAQCGGRKKKKIMLVGGALRIFLVVRVLLCRALAGKRHLEGVSDLFRVRGQVLAGNQS